MSTKKPKFYFPMKSAVMFSDRYLRKKGIKDATHGGEQTVQAFIDECISKASSIAVDEKIRAIKKCSSLIDTENTIKATITGLETERNLLLNTQHVKNPIEDEITDADRKRAVIARQEHRRITRIAEINKETARLSASLKKTGSDIDYFSKILSVRIESINKKTCEKINVYLTGASKGGLKRSDFKLNFDPVDADIRTP